VAPGPLSPLSTYTTESPDLNAGAATSPPGWEERHGRNGIGREARVRSRPGGFEALGSRLRAGRLVWSPVGGDGYARGIVRLWFPASLAALMPGRNATRAAASAQAVRGSFLLV